jgi:hypothetical protein
MLRLMSNHVGRMSPLPPNADIGTQSRNVRFVPKLMHRSKDRPSGTDSSTKPDGVEITAPARAVRLSQATATTKSTLRDSAAPLFAQARQYMKELERRY